MALTLWHREVFRNVGAFLCQVTTFTQWKEQLDVVQPPGAPHMLPLQSVPGMTSEKDTGAELEGLHLPEDLWMPEGALGHHCGRTSKLLSLICCHHDPDLGTWLDIELIQILMDDKQALLWQGQITSPTAQLFIGQNTVASVLETSSAFGCNLL